ncbi:hypothetical protein Agub_g12860, partial [Astrephomene gubernaculifera]
MGSKQRFVALLAALVLCLLGASGSAFAALQVEHSFDGSVYQPAGTLVGDVLTNSELTWQRPDFTKADLELLTKAIKSDGLYSVRVKTDKGTLLTSVPASCLSVSPFTEQAEIHADRNGGVVAFNYAVPSCQPHASSGSSSGSSKADGDDTSERPGTLGVRVLMPTPGPMLTLPEVMGEFADVSVDAADMASLGGAGAGLDPNAKPRAAAPGAKRGGPPPKDERSWLQKNWLFVAAGGMMVLNVLAKA